MQTEAYRVWVTGIVTFAISALAATSAVYWGLKGWERQTPFTVLPALVEPTNSPPSQAVARALGGGMVAVAASSSTAPAARRYGLIGVVAGRGRSGAALISVDDQEAKPVRVGNLLDNDMLLESVSGRQAVLSSTTSASVKITLEMPPLQN